MGPQVSGRVFLLLLHWDTGWVRNERLAFPTLEFTLGSLAQFFHSLNQNLFVIIKHTADFFNSPCGWIRSAAVCVFACLISVWWWCSGSFYLSWPSRLCCGDVCDSSRGQRSERALFNAINASTGQAASIVLGETCQNLLHELIAMVTGTCGKGWDIIAPIPCE